MANYVGKKGAATVLVVVIGLVFLMALVFAFLPQSEKCLLFPDSSKCAGGARQEVLSEATGVLEPSDTAARYNLKNVQLFRRESLDNIKLFDETSLDNGWFSSRSAKTSFEIQEGVKDAKLFVVVNSARGKVKVKLNGHIIERLTGEGTHIVSLPLSKLKSANGIELKSSNPLLPFYYNKHLVGGAFLRQEYTITQSRVGQTVNITQNPKEISRAILKFDTECLSDENLTLIVNSKRVIENKFCAGFEGDISKYLGQKGGFDEITLSSSGNYLIRNVRLDVGVKQKVWPTYYFSIPEERLEELTYLKIIFGEKSDAERKLTLYLNGNSKVLSVDTRRDEWQTVITNYLKEGQNSIMIIPETKVELRKIELN